MNHRKIHWIACVIIFIQSRNSLPTINLCSPVVDADGREILGDKAFFAITLDETRLSGSLWTDQYNSQPHWPIRFLIWQGWWQRIGDRGNGWPSFGFGTFHSLTLGTFYPLSRISAVAIWKVHCLQAFVYFLPILRSNCWVQVAFNLLNWCFYSLKQYLPCPLVHVHL